MQRRQLALQRPASLGARPPKGLDRVVGRAGDADGGGVEYRFEGVVSGRSGGEDGGILGGEGLEIVLYVVVHAGEEGGVESRSTVGHEGYLLQEGFGFGDFGEEGVENEFLLLVHEVVGLSDEHPEEEGAGGENVLDVLGEIVGKDGEDSIGVEEVGLIHVGGGGKTGQPQGDGGVHGRGQGSENDAG